MTRKHEEGGFQVSPTVYSKPMSTHWRRAWWFQKATREKGGPRGFPSVIGRGLAFLRWRACGTYQFSVFLGDLLLPRLVCAVGAGLRWSRGHCGGAGRGGDVFACFLACSACLFAWGVVQCGWGAAAVLGPRCGRGRRCASVTSRRARSPRSRSPWPSPPASRGAWRRGAGRGSGEGGAMGGR
jgi:hypothetical protein